VWKEVRIVKPSSTLIGWVLAAFVGVLLVPAAFGATRPDDRAGQLGVGAAVVATQVAHPNDLAGTLGVGRVALESQPAYWKGERDYGLYTPAGDIAVPAAPVAAGASSGIDWTTVAAGVALVAVLALVAGAVVMTSRQHGGPRRPVPH
jgi:hypothetical protein